jgi:hypothetical protein
LIAYSLYLILRSFFEQRIVLKISNTLNNPETDFIVAEQIIIGTIVTFVAPTVMWFYFYIKFNKDISALDHSVVTFMEVQLYFGLFQTVTIFYLVFVSFWKSPTWWKSYILVGPWIHLFFTATDFILIPICNIIAVFMKIEWVFNSKFGDFIALQGLLAVAILIWFGWQLQSVCV